jgi:hypothetical protein
VDEVRRCQRLNGVLQRKMVAPTKFSHAALVVAAAQQCNGCKGAAPPCYGPWP